MTETLSDIPESWQRIGGPVTRPEDGKDVAVYVDWDTSEGMCDIQIDNGYRGSAWRREEIRRFGDGDFQKGVSRVLGLLVTASPEDLDGSRRYPPLPEA